MNLQNFMTRLDTNLLMNYKEIIPGTPPIQTIGNTPYGQIQNSYAFMNGNGGYTPPPIQTIGNTPYGQMQNSYAFMNGNGGYTPPPIQTIGNTPYGQMQNSYAFMNGNGGYTPPPIQTIGNTPYGQIQNSYAFINGNGGYTPPPIQTIGNTPYGQMQNSYAFMNGNGGYTPPPIQTIGSTPYGQSQIPYVPSSSVPMPTRSVPIPSYQQPMMPPNPYVPTNPMLGTTNMVSYQLQPPLNIGGINGQIQATPNFIQSGCQNLDSVEELKKKLEKNSVLKKECKDFTFIISNTGDIYIFFKRNNRKWIEKFSRKLWANMKLSLICENKAIFIPLTYPNIEKNITDEEIICFLTNDLQSNFFIKKINKEDYLKINGQILCINSDNLLEKIESYECSYFFKTPEGNQLTQNFYLAINNDSYLFIDEKTKKIYSYDSLPKLKELENHLEEVKDYVG